MNGPQQTRGRCPWLGARASVEQLQDVTVLDQPESRATSGECDSVAELTGGMSLRLREVALGFRQRLLLGFFARRGPRC